MHVYYYCTLYMHVLGLMSLYFVVFIFFCLFYYSLGECSCPVSVCWLCFIRRVFCLWNVLVPVLCQVLLLL